MNHSLSSSWPHQFFDRTKPPNSSKKEHAERAVPSGASPTLPSFLFLMLRANWVLQDFFFSLWGLTD